MGLGARHLGNYQAHWRKPRPEVVVVRMDFEFAKEGRMPFVVVVTAEPLDAAPRFAARRVPPRFTFQLGLALR